LEHLNPVEAWHVDAEKHHVGALTYEALERRHPAPCRGDLIASVEMVAQDIEQLRLVVDQQDTLHVDSHRTDAGARAGTARVVAAATQRWRTSKSNGFCT